MLHPSKIACGLCDLNSGGGCRDCPSMNDLPDMVSVTLAPICCTSSTGRSAFSAHDDRRYPCRGAARHDIAHAVQLVAALRHFMIEHPGLTLRGWAGLRLPRDFQAPERL